MADDDCWGAFGSDSDPEEIADVDDDDDDDDDDPTPSSAADDGAGGGDDAPLLSFGPAADATALAITRHFASSSSSRSCGVPIKDRVVGIGLASRDGDGDGGGEGGGDDDGRAARASSSSGWREKMAEMVVLRGMRVATTCREEAGSSSSSADDDAAPAPRGGGRCDAAVSIWKGNRRRRRRPRGGGGWGGREEEDPPELSHCRGAVERSLLPGGFLWSIIPLGGGGAGDDDDDDDDASSRDDDDDDDGGGAGGGAGMMDDCVGGYPESIWDVDSASLVHSSTSFLVFSMRKRSCVINAWSCPWMDKRQRVRGRLLLSLAMADGRGGELPFPTTSADGMTHLQYERNVACAVTISPSVAEREGVIDDASDPSSEGGPASFATILTDANVRRATEILREHGLVIIKGLLPPSQTVPWGDAALEDFNAAVCRLRRHPTRPVDLLNPRTAAADADDAASDEHRAAFEPLSYREMAMREDLRVDLRYGPAMESLRHSQNDHSASRCSGCLDEERFGLAKDDADCGRPSIVDANITGTVACWRFHPSILAIIKSVFNPREGSLFGGNFGRWNFGGAGPDGSPRPFRLGQVGSVLSCPGSGDQAIHADTPHLFEHTDCLPCHYLNVFTPGYRVVDDPANVCLRNEFVDGMWTGNSTMGGTAFVHGSHRLSVSARLLSDDDEDRMTTGKDDDGTDTAMMRKKMLQLRTLRPALDAGDVLFFDCRTIHYGLANTCMGDKTGKDINAGRRPMLYLNVTQSWFHDPKNWDDRERIFD